MHFKRYLDSITFNFYKYKEIINELSTYSFYSKDYEFLVEKLKVLIEKLDLKFIELKNEILDKIKLKQKSLIDIYNDYDEILDNYNNFFDNFFNLVLHYLKNSENFYAPYSLFALIEKIISNFPNNSKFIIIPLFEFNYGYGNLSEFILDKLTTFLNINPLDKFTIFAIPFINRDDILSNALLGHEIGHFLEDYFKMSSNVFNKVSANKYPKLIDLSSKFSNNDTSKRYKFDNIYEQYLDWIKEIISDKLGLNLFGYPYFFAFVILAFFSNPYAKGSDDHPPSWLRLKILIQDIRSDKFKIIKSEMGKIDSNIAEKIENLIKFIEDNFLDNLDSEENDLNQEIVKLIDTDVLDSIDEEIGDKTANLFYKFNIQEIQELITLLDEYITPNQLVDEVNYKTEPVNIISILNAGWIYFLFKQKTHFNVLKKDIKKNEDKMFVLSKLNDLISKGIELSKLEEKYKSEDSSE